VPAAGDPSGDAAAVPATGRAAWLAESLAAVAEHEHALVVPLAAALQAAYAEGRTASEGLLVTSGDGGIVCGEAGGLLPLAWVATEDELAAVLATLGTPPIRRTDAFAPLAHAFRERPGLPGAPALERHLGAAAGTALGLVAIALWGDAEPPEPLLALERLGDLEALVRIGPDGVCVSIPRGQRWLDLQRAGLLDLFTIPWLPGERLEIGTW
jgi:hypothetical protein